MVETIGVLRQIEVDFTLLAFVEFQLGPDFPEYFFPRDSVGFSDEGDKLLKIPVFVNHVFLFDLAVLVDVRLLRIGALEELALSFREDIIAESAFIEVIFFVFEHEFELLHEEAADQFVFPFFEGF